MTCPRCGLQLSEAGITTIQPIECPACGKALSPPASKSGSIEDFIKSYFQDLWQIITHPSAFFERMPTSGGLTRPLCFALVTHWMGSAIGFLWHLLMGGLFTGVVQRFTQIAGDVAEIDSPGRGLQLLRVKDQIFHWLFGAGPVIIDPFLCLFSILVTSVFVYFGARVLITPGISEKVPGKEKSGHRPEQITYESIARVICFGMSPAILAALPLVGGVVSSFCIMIVTVIGIREVFNVGTGRAIVVFLFPKLLFLGIIVMGLLGVAGYMLQFIVSTFHQ